MKEPGVAIQRIHVSAKTLVLALRGTYSDKAVSDLQLALLCRIPEGAELIAVDDVGRGKPEFVLVFAHKDFYKDRQKGETSKETPADGTSQHRAL